MCVCFSYFHQSQSERGWMERPDIYVFVFGPSFRINCKHRKIHSDCLLLFTSLRVRRSDSDYCDEIMFQCLFVFRYFGWMCEAVRWFSETDRTPFTLLLHAIIIMSSNPSHPFDHLKFLPAFSQTLPLKVTWWRQASVTRAEEGATEGPWTSRRQD